jgi:hypothetical protein
MSNSTAYELRYKVLVDAKEMLLMAYDRKCSRSDGEYERTNTLPLEVPLPTAADIIKLAEELYVFVKNKD